MGVKLSCMLDFVTFDLFAIGQAHNHGFAVFLGDWSVDDSKFVCLDKHVFHVAPTLRIITVTFKFFVRFFQTKLANTIGVTFRVLQLLAACLTTWRVIGVILFVGGDD